MTTRIEKLKQLDVLPASLKTDDAGLYIHATMNDGTSNNIFDIRVRGWGSLTGLGSGGRKLAPDTAVEVQKMWADEMCARYNHYAELIEVVEKMREALQVVGLSHEIAVNLGKIDDDGSISKIVNEALAAFDKFNQGEKNG